MLGFSAPQRFFLYRHATDMRKGFDGLAGLVSRALPKLRDPLDGSAYVFINKRRNRLKLLLWESGGFAIYYKRLEHGTFALPNVSPTADAVELGWDELVMLIAGIELASVKRRARFQLPSARKQAV